MINNPETVMKVFQAAKFFDTHHPCRDCSGEYSGDFCSDCYSDDTDFKHSKELLVNAKELFIEDGEELFIKDCEFTTPSDEDQDDSLSN